MLIPKASSLKGSGIGAKATIHLHVIIMAS